MTAKDMYKSFVQRLPEVDTDVLEHIIKTAAKEYYEGSATISDSQFDGMVEVLKKHKPNSDVLTIGWGYKVSKHKKKAGHLYGLEVGSLGKIHSCKELNLGSCSTVLSPKLDGLTAVLYYEDGALTQAITRGDGIMGIDITDKIWTIIRTPGKRFCVEPTFTGAIKGEIIITNSDWELVKEKYPEAKNQRNFASGIINRDELSEDIKYLSIVMYNVLAINSSLKFYEQTEVLKFLNAYADIEIPYEYFETIHEFDDSYLKEIHETYKSTFPIDGIVITDNQIEEDGYHGFDKPVLHQIAYKFEAERKDCIVNGIEWNMSRTGNLIPVVKIDTVELSGTSVSRVTGFNARYISDNKIGVGAIVNVMKSGEIIPDIQHVVKGSDNPNLPEKCPICGSNLEWKGVNLRCSNEDCSSRAYYDIQTFMCTIGSTENIGWSIMEKFLEELQINTVGDLLSYGYNPIEDRGQKQRMLFNEVLKKIFIDPIDAVDALCALNIPSLGRVSASKLAANKDLLDRIMNEIIGEPGYIVSKIELSETVGRAVADSIMSNYRKLLYIDTIWDRLVFSTPVDTSEMTEVCITGKLSVKRSVFEEELKQYGFISSGIGKKTKYLITDNPNGASSKNKKATELGIEKITEADFRERFMK